MNILLKIIKSNLNNIIRFSALVLIILLSRKTFNYLSIFLLNRKLKEIARNSIQNRNKRLDEFYEKYNEYENLANLEKENITNLRVVELRDLLRKRKINCKQLIIAYGLNVSKIGKDLNLIADVNLDEALKQSEISDEIIQTGDMSKIRPLEGIPISIKDHIDVKGYLSTLGYITNFNNYASEDALFVKILRKKGAIPFVKSNVSQGLMSLESCNNLWGDAKNPLNTKVTPGGSSGGEAALVVSKCSPIGIGTDFAGSIRIPCSFTGLYGFKPSSSRISTLGHINMVSSYFTGFNVIKPSWGPIARNIDDIILILENIFGEFEEDPSVTNNKKFDYTIYKQILDSSKIRILVFMDYDFCETANQIKMEINNFISILRNEGCLIDLISRDNKYFSIFNSLLNFASILLNNSNELINMRKGLKFEYASECYKDWFNMIDYSSIWKKIWGCFLKIKGETRLGNIVTGNKFISREDYLDSIRFLEEAKHKFFNEFIRDGYDCLLMPVMPFPAFEIGLSSTANYFNHFCLITNILDMPSGSLPLGKFNEKSSYNYDTKFNDTFAKNIQNTIKNANGLPYGVQLATLPNKDELCLNLMNFIDKFIKINLNPIK